MKIATVNGLLVVGLNAALATATVDGAKDKVIAALAARDVPAHEIKAIVNLMPRDTVTVTTTVDCTPFSYGPPVSVTTTLETTTTFETTTETATPSETPATLTTTVVPPESVTSVDTETATAIPTLTPAVPTFGTDTVNTVGTTPVTTNVVETTSATTDENSSTFTSSSAGFTATTSTIPPAVNNAITPGSNVDMGWVVGLMAVVALF